MQKGIIGGEDLERSTVSSFSPGSLRGMGSFIHRLVSPFGKSDSVSGPSDAFFIFYALYQMLIVRNFGSLTGAFKNHFFIMSETCNSKLIGFKIEIFKELDPIMKSY